MTTPEAPGVHPGLRSVIAVAVLVLIAAALRISGLNSELWFDELASLRSVTPMRTLGQVLWSDHTDNKHHLTWAWLWLTGPGHPEWLYRLPSFLAGVATPPLLWFVVRRSFGRLAGLLAGALAAFCYPLVFYSSEARGYAAAVALAVLAYALAPGPARPTTVRRAVAFNLCLIAGFLAHLTFAYAYAGLLAWAAVDVLRRPRWLATVVACHAPAAMVMAIIWWFDVSRMTFAGGPPTAAVTVLRYLAAMTFGTPVDGPLPWLAVAAAVALCVVGITIVGRRRGAGRVAFFVVALFVVPVVLTVTRRTPYLAVRYYLVVVPFALMLIAIALAALARRPWGRIVAMCVSAAIVIQGVVGASQLAILGRGHVRAALSRMAADAAPLTFASERPVMDGANVDYYAAALPGHPTFIDRSDPSSPPPTWWVLDLDDPQFRGPDTIRRRGQTYRLDAIYPSNPVSGLTWDVYRRVDPER